MSDTMLGVLVGISIIIPPALAVLAYVANRNSSDNVPFWQAAIFVVLFIAAIGGMAGIGVAGADHFHGEFAEGYLMGGGLVAFVSGVFLVIGLLDID